MTIRVKIAVWQDYELRVNDEFVLRGNAGLLKCLVPSFVSDVLQIEAWITDQGDVYRANDHFSGNWRSH